MRKVTHDRRLTFAFVVDGELVDASDLRTPHTTGLVPTAVVTHAHALADACCHDVDVYVGEELVFTAAAFFASACA